MAGSALAAARPPGLADAGVIGAIQGITHSASGSTGDAASAAGVGLAESGSVVERPATRRSPAADSACAKPAASASPGVAAPAWVAPDALVAAVVAEDGGSAVATAVLRVIDYSVGISRHPPPGGRGA